MAIEDLLKLEDHEVSPTHGFLPSEPPSTELPKYYAPWETISSNLNILRVEKKLASKIALLPMLTTYHLTNQPEWRRAYVLLGFIANAYIWGSGKPKETLPANIAVPFVEVAEHLDMPPIPTYGAQNLWNFRLLDAKRPVSDPANLCALTTFTASVDESWFYAIPTAIEARGAPIISLALKAFQAVSLDRVDTVIACLEEICIIIEALTALLARMYEKCHPTIFYNEIRPFLAGTTSTELARGVCYEQKDGKGSHKSFKGPTAAQSSLFHFLDISFGIRHRPTGMEQDMNGHANAASSTEEKFLKEMRQYMPSRHRNFLQAVTKTANIRQYVTSHRDNIILQEAYNACLEKLVRYRTTHVQIVSRYIVIPSRAAAKSALPPNTEPGTAGRVPADDAVPADKENHNNKKAAALGTGGTAPVEFLKQVRDETQQSLLHH